MPNPTLRSVAGQKQLEGWRQEEQDKAEEHRVKHQRYKPDDNARDRAVGLARKKYPAADRAANSLVVYLLNRKGAPELDEAYQFVDPQDESP